MKFFLNLETTFGTFALLEENENLTQMLFHPMNASLEAEEKATLLLKDARQQLLEYLAGSRTEFLLPLNPAGTPFQQKAWAALCRIPYGETRSYKQLAEMLENPKACRAVGMANNKNPLPIFIPCHRVIGASGKLVGYAGGLELKQQLLALEQQPKQLG